jgi:hypothetical protein
MGAGATSIGCCNCSGVPGGVGTCHGCVISTDPLTCSLVWETSSGYGCVVSYVTTTDTLNYGAYDSPGGGTATDFHSDWAPNPSYQNCSGAGADCAYYRLVGCAPSIQFARDAEGTQCALFGEFCEAGTLPFCAGSATAFDITCSPFSVAWDNSACAYECPACSRVVEPISVFIVSGVLTQ